MSARKLITHSTSQQVLTSVFIFSAILLAEYIEARFNYDPLIHLSVWLTSGLALSFYFIYGKQVTFAVFLASAISAFLSLPDINIATNLAYSTFHALCVTLQSLGIFVSFRYFSKEKKPLLNSTSLIQFIGLCILASISTCILTNLNHSTFITHEPLLTGKVFDLFYSNLTSLIILPAVFFSLPEYFQNKRKNPFNLENYLWLAVCLSLAFTSYKYDFAFILFALPLLIWAATRFEQLACSLCLVITTTVIFNGIFPVMGFASELFPGHSLDISWLALITATLYINTLRLEHHRMETTLEETVLQRTRELQTANLELQDEIYIRQQAELSFRLSSKRFKSLFETAGIPIIVLNDKLCIKQWNNSAEVLFGYVAEEVMHKNFIDIFIPTHMQDETAWKFTKVIKSGLKKESLESKTINHEGLSHIMLWNMSQLVDENDDPRQNQLLLIGQNISEIRKTQNQLHYLAHFDALTGTANRRLFEDRCEQAIQSALRHKHSIAVIGLDIDHFKRINDTLGHDAGDQFLIVLADRLKQCIRKEDTVARLGGDEFAILLSNVSGREGAEKVGRNILETITQPINIKGNVLIITSSIGITLCPSDGNYFPELLKNSDMAMYRAKKAGRNNIQFYSVDMNNEMKRQLLIEQELRTALLENQLQLYYQPIIDIETGEVLALEALLRWIHPEKKMLKPDYFLHVAEQTGLLHEIGEWALKNVCLHGRVIHQWSKTPIQIALNLSSRQFNHPRLIDTVENITRETNFNPHNLILEMSENTITSDINTSFTTLDKLKKLGLSLTLDSFGTGLSSLRELKKMPIDIIKIDQTFVSGIPNDESDMAITETLLAIADQMDLKTFATGVETKQQEAFLKIHGCRYAQGYLYAEPVPFKELAPLFERINAGHSLNSGEQIFLPFEHDKK